MGVLSNVFGDTKKDFFGEWCGEKKELNVDKENPCCNIGSGAGRRTLR